MAIRKIILPSAYQQVEYIESSGTQYIDTGYYATTTSGINIDYAYTASGNAGLCGIFQSQTPRTDTLFISTLSGQTSTVIYLISRGGELTNNVVPTLGTKYNAKINYLNNGKLIIDNTKTGNDGSNGVVSSRTIKLFCRDNSGNLAYTNARIYMCKISEGGNIVRNFIPCYRKSDNVIGLYDLVNGVFYTNAGSGDFTKGNDYAPKIKHILKNAPLLPTGYQQVNYIESTGEQYLDLGYYPNQDTKVETNVRIVSHNGSVINYLFGVYDGTRSFAIYYSYNSRDWGVMCGSVDSNTGIAYQQSVKHKLEFDKDYLSIDGGTDTYAVGSTSTFTSTRTMYLFWGNGTSRLKSISRIYDFKIYENGNIVMNLIPALDPNGVPCMYDTVSKQPFYNQGTGTFNVGSNTSSTTLKRIIKKYKGTSLYFYDVPSIYQRVEYIEATGTQYINTGIETAYDEWNMYLTFQRGATMGGTIFGAFAGFEVYLESSQPNYKAQNVTSNVQAQIGTFNSIRLRPQPVLNGIITLTVDGVANTMGEVVYSYGNTIGLCGMGDGTNLIAGLFGEFKVQKGTKTLMHLLPCYRKSDNVVGMYDVISGQFFTNNGTGTFGKGADL